MLSYVHSVETEWEMPSPAQTLREAYRLLDIKGGAYRLGTETFDAVGHVLSRTDRAKPCALHPEQKRGDGLFLPCQEERAVRLKTARLLSGTVMERGSGEDSGQGQGPASPRRQGEGLASPGRRGLRGAPPRRSLAAQSRREARVLVGSARILVGSPRLQGGALAPLLGAESRRGARPVGKPWQRRRLRHRGPACGALRLRWDQRPRSGPPRRRAPPRKRTARPGSRGYCRCAAASNRGARWRSSPPGAWGRVCRRNGEDPELALCGAIAERSSSSAAQGCRRACRLGHRA